jgi:hypothetical protein
LVDADGREIPEVAAGTRQHVHPPVTDAAATEFVDHHGRLGRIRE